MTRFPKRAVALLLWCSVAFSAAAAERWELLVPAAMGPASQAAWQAFAQRISDASRGALQVTPTAAVASEEALVQQARSRPVLAVIPLASLQPAPLEMAAFDALFVFPGLAAVTDYQASVEGRRALEALRTIDLEGLAYTHHGMVQLLSRPELLEVKDYRGLRVGTASLPRSIAPQFRALGARPVTTDLSERVTGLRQGALDAAEFTWSDMARIEMPEPPSFEAMATNHRYVGYVVVANREAVERLPPTLRLRLHRDALAAAAELNARIADQEHQAEQMARRRFPPKLMHFAKPEPLVAQDPVMTSSVWPQAAGNDVARVIGPALASSDLQMARRVFPGITAPLPADTIHAPGETSGLKADGPPGSPPAVRPPQSPGPPPPPRASPPPPPKAAPPAATPPSRPAAPSTSAPRGAAEPGRHAVCPEHGFVDRQPRMSDRQHPFLPLRALHLPA